MLLKLVAVHLVSACPLFTFFLTRLPMLLLSVPKHDLMFVLMPSHLSDLDTLDLAVYRLIRLQIFLVANMIKPSFSRHWLLYLVVTVGLQGH